MALKAGSKLRFAFRLLKGDQKSEALAIARDGLSILCLPLVNRMNPAEGTLLVQLTIFVEELSSELQHPGASRDDLVDTLEIIKQLPAEFSADKLNLKAWVPYLEAKVERLSKTPLGHPSTG